MFVNVMNKKKNRTSKKRQTLKREWVENNHRATSDQVDRLAELGIPRRVSRHLTRAEAGLMIRDYMTRESRL